MNGAKLKLWIRQHGYRMDWIAEQMGITSSGLSQKIKRNSFSCSDAVALLKIGMSEEDLIDMDKEH